MKHKRFFNTEGPIKKDIHYFIEPLDRIDLEEILSLVHHQKYFVLHAPRQTGKTTLLLALVEHLNKQGTYKCLYINIEDAQAARENVKEGMRTVLTILANYAFNYLNDSFLKEKWTQIFEENGEFYALQDALIQWCKHSEKPVVLFIDEVDSLVGDTLVSLLRQLRSGYTGRPAMFPHSIILCGVRDVRDYRIHSAKEKAIITGGSAFNIKSKSLRLGDFTPGEINMLYEQHTEETGQTFNKDIFPLVWELTEGQPWLVNALAYETCFDMKDGRDREKEITVDMVSQAKENIILGRQVHLDQLVARLSEERVRSVIEPIMVGAQEAGIIPLDNVDYAADLGLIKKEPELRISNRIYQEVIPRGLIDSTQLTILQESLWYTDDEGRLDMDKLLTAFQDFFRKHFESWVGAFDYREAGAQLLLQAFLHRIINRKGRVVREYGLGRQRTDLLLIWPVNNGVQEIVLELKLLYAKLETVIDKGLEQTWAYMDKCGTSEGYLLIFDRSKKRSWKEKIFKQDRTFKGTKIGIYGM